MRKLTALLLSLLLLCSMGMTVFAEGTIITTTVPGTHTITVIADGADVFCNGQAGTLFTVNRLSQPTLLIRAASGKEITQIRLNDEDITSQVKGGYYTLEPIYEDKILTVVTRDAAPAQGGTYTVQGTVKRNGQQVPGLTVELRSTPKTDVTNKDGKFSFSKVSCGKHSLTVIESGKLVGYVEFALTEGSAANLSFSSGFYSVTVNKNESGIDLTLLLMDDDTMRITSATGVKASGNQSDKTNPQTGDNANPLFWLVWMLVVITGLMASLTFGRKRKSGK